MGLRTYRYDAFISHAVEDKITLANDLYKNLTQAGLKIWYSGKELGVGDSIEEAVYSGLKQSRFGIVIISPDYLSKRWALQEFHALLYKERDGVKVILPILHRITLAEVVAKYPFMSERYCISSDRGIDYVVEKLLETIRKPGTRNSTKLKRAAWIASVLFFAFCLIYIGYSAIQNILGNDPAAAFTKDAIQKRIERFQQKIDAQHSAEMSTLQGKSCGIKTIDSLFTAYQKLKAYYRNTYEFSNGYTTIHSRKNIEPALQIDIESLTPYNSYQFTQPLLYLFAGKTQEFRYTLINTQPLQYTTNKEHFVDENTYEVSVDYKNNVRYINVSLTFAPTREGTKRHQMTLLGFSPRETYIFEKKNDAWELAEVK